MSACVTDLLHFMHDRGKMQETTEDDHKIRDMYSAHLHVGCSPLHDRSRLHLFKARSLCRLSGRDPIPIYYPYSSAMFASHYRMVPQPSQPPPPTHSPQILITPSSSEDLALHLIAPPPLRDPLLTILSAVDPASTTLPEAAPRHIYSASSLLSQTSYPNVEHLHVPDAATAFRAGIQAEILACPKLKTLEIVFKDEEAEDEASRFLTGEERAGVLRRRGGSSRVQGLRGEGDDDEQGVRTKGVGKRSVGMLLSNEFGMPKERVRLEIEIRGERISEGGNHSVDEGLLGRPSPIELVKSLISTQSTYHCRFPGCQRSRGARGAGFAREGWRYNHEVSEHGPKGECKHACWFEGCSAGPFGEWRALCSHLQRGHGRKRLWAQKPTTERGEVFDPEYDGFESSYDNPVRFPYQYLEKFLQGLPLGCVVLLDVWVPWHRVTAAKVLERMGLCKNFPSTRWRMSYWDEG